MTEQEMEDKVKIALEEIRPFLLTDGGDIELVKIEGDSVYVRFLGACTACSVNQSTLKLGVEQTIKKYLPEIKEVINLA